MYKSSLRVGQNVKKQLRKYNFQMSTEYSTNQKDLYQY